MAAAASSSFSTSPSRSHLLSTSLLKSTTDQLSSIACVQKGRNFLKIRAALAQEKADAEREGAQGEAMARLQNTRLYFGNLPYNCDREQLNSVVQEHARPEIIEVLHDKEAGRSRGFAFVTMSTIQDCEAVIANLNGFRYGGRTLRVKLSDKSKGRAAIESEFKLFVGNLSWSVTAEALKQVFKDYGNVVSARVLYDGETGRSRGYGFVCFSSREEMDAAMESLNGVRLLRGKERKSHLHHAGKEGATYKNDLHCGMHNGSMEELEGRALRISLALGKKT